MKAVLISVKPYYCGKITLLEKFNELRKNRPLIEPPFKCYIYCTKDPKLTLWCGPKYSYADDHSHNMEDCCGNGKLIAEFVCDQIRGYTPDYLVIKEDAEKALAGTCVTRMQALNYLRGNQDGYSLTTLPDFYCWHVSDLIRYPEPKDISELYKPGTYSMEEFLEREYDGSGCPSKSSYDSYLFTRTMRRPPQSWCYVEEL